LGLPVPELVFIELDEAFGRTEADEEIQELLQKSQGLNLGLHFLSGALNFDPNTQEVEAKLASQTVWLDAYITNVDRTFRNTNLLLWHKELWLIDHGAAFYFHHSWDTWEKHAISPFALIKDHVLLPQARLLEEVNAEFQTLLTDEKLHEIVAHLPDDWLNWEGNEQTPDEIRAIYYQFLVLRKSNANTFVNQAQHARTALI
jgi:hypothetical protein